MKSLLFSYLKFWAVGYLKRTNPKIIGITGSVGKTSTKEAIFEVLNLHFQKEVRKSFGNLNNETGLPLAILDYQFSPVNFWDWLKIISSTPFKSLTLKPVKILILEYAADKPGDIKYLTNIARPDIAVLTAIGGAHLSAFGTIDKIIEEKSDLLRALPQDGWAVLNLQDKNVRKVSYGLTKSKITYAISEPADIRATDIKTGISELETKTSFTVKLHEKTLKIIQPTLGEYANVLSSLAAIAVGEIFKLRAQEIERGLGRVKGEKHRQQIVQGKNQTVIIDDVYNANPLSMKAALEVLKAIPRFNNGRKVAVLGDMREIGNDWEGLHREIGSLAHEVSDEVIAYGRDAKHYQAKKYFSTVPEISKYLLSTLRKNDIILIKGSRAMKMEEIVDELREEA